MPTSESQSRSGSRAVERAVAVLGCFDDGAAELTVSSLAARAGLPVSSAHRIAQALVRGGLLERAPDGYRIGSGLISLAVPPLVRLGADACAPQLYALAAGIGITASLAVVRGDDALTVFSARPPDRFCDIQIPRARQPVDTSVMGRAVLAFEQLGRRRASRESEVELDRIRRRGFAVDVDIDDPTVLAVAVPVFDNGNRPWGAVGVQARRRRLNEPTVRRIVPAMQHTAALIARTTESPAVRVDIDSR